MGKGAIAVVRASGPGVPALAQSVARSAVPLRPRVATRATIVDERGDVLDLGLAILFPAPHSYTGDDVLELHLHGSPIVAREVLRALVSFGARLAEPGEFTRRAFLNGKMDLHAAAAVADVIDAETRAATRAALANVESGLAADVAAARAVLSELLEELAAAIDFPDEVREPAPEEVERRIAPIFDVLERLRRDGERGRLLREGVRVAIVGPPNAGKSSLLNALLGMERAIVSDVAGTTRDTIEEAIAIDGVPVRLVDTAGIRSHADRLEGAGIERTRRALDLADVALVVIDGSRPRDRDTRRVLEQTRSHERILFFNKADLGMRGAPEAGARAVVGSVHDEHTLAAIRRAVAAAAWGGDSPDLTRPHPVALHEFEAIAAARDALRAARDDARQGAPIDAVGAELHRAFSSLGHVSERVAAEDILNGIFARFCIGK